MYICTLNVQGTFSFSAKTHLNPIHLIYNGLPTPVANALFLGLATDYHLPNYVFYIVYI